MPDRLIIRAESPDQPDARALLASSTATSRRSIRPRPTTSSMFRDCSRRRSRSTWLVKAVRPWAPEPFAACLARRETGGQPFGEIKRMYVDPAFRGREIGIKLLDVIERQLRSEGIRLALLETGATPDAGGAPVSTLWLHTTWGVRWLSDNGLSVFYGKAI
jgi:putative acetyltransferase